MPITATHQPTFARAGSPTSALYLNAPFAYLLDVASSRCWMAFRPCPLKNYEYSFKTARNIIMCLRHAHASPSIYEIQTKVNLDPAFILQAIYFGPTRLEALRRPSQPFIEALENDICAWIIWFYFCFILAFSSFSQTNLHFHAFINLLIIKKGSQMAVEVFLKFGRFKALNLTTNHYGQSQVKNLCKVPE